MSFLPWYFLSLLGSLFWFSSRVDFVARRGRKDGDPPKCSPIGSLRSHRCSTSRGVSSKKNFPDWTSSKQPASSIWSPPLSRKKHQTIGTQVPFILSRLLHTGFLWTLWKTLRMRTDVSTHPCGWLHLFPKVRGQKIISTQKSPHDFEPWESYLNVNVVVSNMDHFYKCSISYYLINSSISHLFQRF